MTNGDAGRLHGRGHPAPVLNDRQVKVALVILTVVNMLNFIDRQIITILAEPIRRDLHLSDTQLGLMTGFAFALFYAVLGLPLARLADRPGTNRVALISICLAVWSAMTAVGGLAQSFTQLLLARIGVGAGEAGGTPSAHSLISDMTPPEKRASAMAFFGFGLPVGALLGWVLGGGLFDLFGWRSTLMMVGLPGLALALVLLAVVKEPRRLGQPSLARPVAASPAVGLKEAFVELGKSRTFLFLALAGSLVAFLSQGKGVWQAVLFIRVFGLTPGQTGLWLGLTMGLAGIVGMFLGGFLADRLGRKRPSRIVLAPAVGLAVTAPLMLLGYLHTDWRISLALLFLPSVASVLFYGPTFSLAHRLVPPHMRAMSTAIMIFAHNLIGGGLGPLIFGMTSDALAPIAGTDSVRWTLASSAFFSLVPALLFWLAGRHVERDIRS